MTTGEHRAGSAPVVFTIGHSTLAVEAFIALLTGYAALRWSEIAARAWEAWRSAGRCCTVPIL